jgi:hypothetical protein
MYRSANSGVSSFSLDFNLRTCELVGDMDTNNNKIFSRVQLLQFLVAFFVTAFGIITAYYTTIAGIKLDLSKKAESEIVNQLDKRLSNIEILLSKNFLTKDEFYYFSEDLQKRLTKIEYQLSILNEQ